MNVPHMSSEQFRRAGHEMIDLIATYLETVDRQPVTPDMQPGDLFRRLPPNAPEQGEAWSALIEDVRGLVLPALTHWQSPHFHAFFPCNNSGPAILGELLSAGLGVNGFLWQCSPAITELEMRVMDWLGRALSLPECFLFGEDYARGRGGGVIQGTASEAVLTALVAALARVKGAKPVAYATAQAHSSVVKAAMVAGIGRERVHMIDTDSVLAMRPDALAARVREDRAAGFTPAFVCATVGTTATGAVDPVRPIAELARNEGLWCHVDAAYAGAACLCPEHRAMIDGLDLADSFNFNPHKWLLTNFDCSAFWVSDRASLINAMNITPEYLRNKASDSGLTIDYRDWHVPLGRRFRALKLWFVMRHYGLEGLRAHIREHVRLGTLFESLVRADDRFEIPTPRCLSLVCFRLKGNDEANRALIERLNATRRIFLTATTVPIGPAGSARTILRMAIGATRTQEQHVRDAWTLIQREADHAG